MANIERRLAALENCGPRTRGEPYGVEEFDAKGRLIQTQLFSPPAWEMVTVPAGDPLPKDLMIVQVLGAGMSMNDL